MSDSRLYTRLLLPKGHGYPLFRPPPYDDLPPELHRQGTTIGDVGVVRPDGSFDVIFNICRAGDDPLNRYGVPERFEKMSLLPGDIATLVDCHRPGSDVSSITISKRRLGVNAGGNVFLSAAAGAVIDISTSSNSTEAAILVLPDGASRNDVRPLDSFRQYAIRHAHRWYDFVNGPLQRGVHNGDLYLVTGTDKSSSWAIAAFENRSVERSVSLELRAAQIGTAGTTYSWEWDTMNCISHSGPATPSETQNQTVFLRGFRVMVRSSRFAKCPVGIYISDSKPENILQRGRPFNSSSQPRAVGANPSLNNARISPSSTSPNDGLVSDSDDCKVSHPSSAIIQFLVDSTPDATVAIVHDNQWLSVLTENDQTFPDDSELIKRIYRKYSPVKTPDGTVSLQEDCEPRVLCKSSIDSLAFWAMTPGYCPATNNKTTQSQSNGDTSPFMHHSMLFSWQPKAGGD
ncbi:hypothetical protein MSAN_00598800 [Mycena sanguinolenta]|uniref:Uncharacterized protein n=1 Tax=Mycena sanguinolenta TaxID=230812 RepID=A0A8H6ZAL0_9AGAR|nr:hypothetical protein MSAN_00598800 [Mycena sanguinolenta]